MGDKRNPKYNQSGYADPTAHSKNEMIEINEQATTKVEYPRFVSFVSVSCQ